MSPPPAALKILALVMVLFIFVPLLQNVYFLIISNYLFIVLIRFSAPAHFLFQVGSQMPSTDAGSGEAKAGVNTDMRYGSVLKVSKIRCRPKKADLGWCESCRGRTEEEFPKEPPTCPKHSSLR